MDVGSDDWPDLNLPVSRVKMDNGFADKRPDRRSGQHIGRPMPVIIQPRVSNRGGETVGCNLHPGSVVMFRNDTRQSKRLRRMPR